ncbi:protein ACTIVITY OF BC1 COMPLEX KINASE 7, chloroplastic isoform X2 [Silene latifolia]|uniref:protein ACTIVITY OF BC1 COMPLEX KINASE 7, chloroplastic isoform X2 n=1 Tax=Silene latifolia TaxID=37657 RepID=UPI003D775FB7
MAAILASQSCHCRHMELPPQRLAADDLGFSCSISGQRSIKFEKQVSSLPASPYGYRLQVEMRQTKEPADLNGNGRSYKMVPITEVIKTAQNSTVNGTSKVVNGVNGTKKVINGANKVVNGVNGTKQAINGVSITKKQTAYPPVKRSMILRDEGLPPLEEPRVLPSDSGFSWANDNYNSVQRSIDVWSFVLSLRVRVLLENAKWAYAGGFDEEKQKKRRRGTAAWLRERVLQLGPTFIKLGQLSSTRSDLFPREYVDELAKLQDRVPAFSSKKAKEFIAAELGAPVDVLFREFEDQPIAAASLGQVHRAILHNGEKVVVKVQRPGLKRLFDIDLQNLKLIAEYFQNSESLGGPTRDWIGIYEECATILYQEIDYVNEGKNADRFRRDFRNVKWVRVPLVHWDYTALKVLTLEYVPGVKINKLEKLDERGYNRPRIASRAIEGYLIQVVQNLIDLGALQPTGDLSAVRRSVQFFLNNLLGQSPDQQQTLAAIGEDLFAIAQDQPFRFPSTFTFVLRAFSTLEGVGYTLDPKFSFVKVAAPYAQELLDLKERRRSGAALVQEIRKQAEDARDSTVSMPSRVQRIEDFVKQLEAGDLKLRVRVLESERAARKATVLQMATMYTVLGGTLLNLGVTFSGQGSEIIANGSFIGAGVFLTLLIRSMQRVKKLDNFEKMI